MGDALDEIDEPVEPIFVSSEHGDGLPELFKKMKSYIPESKEREYEERKEKRIGRYLDYKQMLLDEIVELKEKEIEKAANVEQEEDDDEKASPYDEEDMKEFDPAMELEAFIKSWEKEFDGVNRNPEENSDFDSDNDINPLDTLDSLGRYYNSQEAVQQMSSENAFKRRQIQLSIVGKPNTGKSTLVNSLL